MAETREARMRPPETGTIVQFMALFFLFPVLLSACSALAPFASLPQWLLLNSAQIGAL
jgi:hypothetical protein